LKSAAEVGRLRTSVFVGNNVNLAFLLTVNFSLLQQAGAESTHSGGVGNRAVRVAKGQADSNPLRGVVLRAHGWWGSRGFARSWNTRKITDSKSERKCNDGCASQQYSFVEQVFGV
jgi:hypothetical protein